MGLRKLSANAKNVSANAKSSFSAILALRVSFFLRNFEAEYKCKFNINNSNNWNYEKNDDDCCNGYSSYDSQCTEHVA
jgi:hypothetical protein